MPVTEARRQALTITVSKVDGLQMCIGSATGRHERLGGDQSRPFVRKRSCVLLALDDKVLDLRHRAINLALVVERAAGAVRKPQSLSGQAVSWKALEGNPLKNISPIADPAISRSS